MHEEGSEFAVSLCTGGREQLAILCAEHIPAMRAQRPMANLEVTNCITSACTGDICRYLEDHVTANASNFLDGL